MIVKYPQQVNEIRRQDHASRRGTDFVTDLDGLCTTVNAGHYPRPSSLCGRRLSLYH